MKNIVITFVLTLALTCAFHVSAGADTIAIINGKVVVGNGTVYDGGIVLIKDGIIQEVGVDVEVPPDARVIDASGLWVWPGMIDPFTSVGMVEVSMDRSTNDTNESTSTNTAQLRAVDGINPDSITIPIARNGGITTVLTSPGRGNPINGQAAIINLAGTLVSKMLLVDNAAITFNFSSGAASYYSTRREGSYPSTRPGTVAFIRQTLYDARRYGAQKAAAEKKNAEEEKDKPGEKEKDGNSFSINLKNEALLRALSGEIPVIAGASEVQEIRNALSVADEFKLRLILLNPMHCWKMLDEIRERNIPILLGSTFSTPSDRDPYDRYFRLAATLQEAGILFAFTTASSHSVRQLPTRASMSVAFGLSEEDAVKALTVNPSIILGIEESVGSLETGKIANVAIWNGNPLQNRSKVVILFIAGEEVSLVTNQELLRDKFTR